MRMGEIVTEHYRPRPLPGFEVADAPGDLSASRMLTPRDRSQLIEWIRDNCGPWLAASNRGTIYRAIDHSAQGADMFLRDVRTNRQPSDSSVEMTRLFDIWIESVGGVAKRTNSAFVTSDRGMAGMYGTIYTVMPVGDFHYTWSPIWRDWYREFKVSDYLGPMDASVRVFDMVDRDKIRTKLGDRAKQPQYEWLRQNRRDVSWSTSGLFQEPDFDEFDRRLYDQNLLREHIVADRGLDQAIASGHEMMIQCDTMLYLNRYTHEAIIDEI